MHALQLLRDLPGLPASFPDCAWVRDLQQCPQDPEYHPEGDVWTHTLLVLEALAALPAWSALPPVRQQILLWAALLHDVGKPATTREEDGRLRSPHHSSRGEVLARRILWEAQLPFELREQICALIRFHQLPFHFESLTHWRPLEVSLRTRNDDLGLLAQADAAGRGRPTSDEERESMELYALHCEALGCLDCPFPFPTPGARVAHYWEGKDPRFALHEESRGELTLVCGLPGTGKDTWSSKQQLPRISLDSVRDELGEPRRGGNEGRVIQEAREQAREHLRAGRSFLWNATGLQQRTRSSVLRLGLDYGFTLRIVYLEVPPARLLEQNRSRVHALPEAALYKMMQLWELPTLCEAHTVEYRVSREPEDR